MPSAVGFPSSPTVGQQWPTASPRWQWDGTRWAAIAGALVTNRLTSLVNTDDFLALRTISGEPVPHLVAASVVAEFAGAAPAPSAPAAFTVGMWDADPTANPGEISFDLDPLPSDGGSPITALQYRVGTGSAILFTGTGAGVRVVTAGLTAGAAADLQVRAVNAVDAGPWSDVKTRTPAAAGGGGATLTISQDAGASIVGGQSNTYRNGGGTSAGYWEPGNGTARMLWRPGANFNTANIPGVITAATLRIYMDEQFGASTVTAYDNLRAWVSDQVSWAEYASGSAWATAGGSGAADRSASNIGTASAPATTGVWVEIPLDAAVVESWRQEGGVGASGLQLAGNDQWSRFITDVGTAGFRPQLVVTHA